MDRGTKNNNCFKLMYCRLNNTCDLKKRNCKTLIFAVSFFMNFLVSSYVYAQIVEDSENTYVKSTSDFKKENLACKCDKYQLRANREFELVLAKTQHVSHSEKNEPFIKSKSMKLGGLLPIRFLKKKRLKNAKFSKLRAFHKSFFKRTIQQSRGVDACSFL